MHNLDDKSIYFKKLICYITLFLLAGVLQYTDNLVLSVPLSTFMGVSAQLIFISVALAWSISIDSRMISKKLKFCILFCIGQIVLWQVLRFTKYNLFNYDDTIRRYLWYAYYVPQLLVPLFVYMLAVYIVRPSIKLFDKRFILPSIISIVLIILIFTNDIHQTAFKVTDHFIDWNKNYEHGVTYYIAMVYILGLLIYSIILLFNKCKISSMKKKLWIPLLIVAIGTLVTLLSFLNVISIYKVPELFCLTFALTIESCIEIGFIPSNSNYNKLFYQSGIPMMILDDKNSIIYASQYALKYESLFNDKRLGKSNDYLNNFKFNSFLIHGGRVEWIENITIINNMNKKLFEFSNQLSEENELLAAESRLKEKMISTITETNLYNEINNHIKDKVELVGKLLTECHVDDADFKHKISHICVINSFIKRRSNLEIIGTKMGLLNLDELKYSIHESLDYLSGCNIMGNVTVINNGEYNYKDVIACYEFFELFVEQLIQYPTSIYVVCTGYNDFFELKIITSSLSPVVFTFITDYANKVDEALHISTEEDSTYVVLTKRGDVR